MIEVAEFRAHEGFWAKDVVWCHCSEMDARTWWNGISVVASAILLQLLLKGPLVFIPTFTIKKETD